MGQVWLRDLLKTHTEGTLQPLHNLGTFDLDVDQQPICCLAGAQVVDRRFLAVFLAIAVSGGGGC